MPFSESLAARTRDALAREPGISEKKMFGGLSFLLHGKLLVGVFKNSLIARVGPEQAKTALKKPHVGVFDITGRPMKGWVLVEPEGVERQGRGTAQHQVGHDGGRAAIGDARQRHAEQRRRDQAPGIDVIDAEQQSGQDRGHRR